MRGCEFCNLLKISKEIAENRPTRTYKYSVKLIEESFKGNHHAGTETSRGFEINYCPVCGKGLKGQDEVKGPLVYPEGTEL